MGLRTSPLQSRDCGTRALRFLKLALRVAMQNGRELVDLVQQYISLYGLLPLAAPKLQYPSYFKIFCFLLVPR
jgi:hypothetical protein